MDQEMTKVLEKNQDQISKANKENYSLKEKIE